MYDDARIMRERHSDLVADERAGDVPDSSSVVLGQTYTAGTYPTAAQRSYAMRLVEISGTETEGSTPTLTALTGTTFQAINLGASIPASGTNVLCFQTRGFWVFRYG